MDDDTLRDVTVELDARAALSTLNDLEARSKAVGRALTGALTSATVGGRGLDDTLRRLGDRLASIALSAGLKPLENLFSGAVGGLLSGIGGTVTPFAKGGVVREPGYFPLAGGTGLMGEAGPEAILPLSRGADGSLGVAATGGGGPNITFNVTATDAASFRKSEGQIAAMLARSVARGQRNL